MTRYNWKGIHFQIKVKKFKKSGKHNQTVVLKILFFKSNQEEMKQVYFSENNSEPKEPAKILMISEGKKSFFCSKKYLLWSNIKIYW